MIYLLSKLLPLALLPLGFSLILLLPSADALDGSSPALRELLGRLIYRT